MVVGIIGVGAVGGTLNKWFVENTNHEVRLYDPAKGHLDFLTDCEAIFISVPVPENNFGQDQSILESAVLMAQRLCPNVFIRSTVLPGTNDRLNTISMPEFLTEATAFADMCRYPILCGTTDPELVARIFPNKKIIMMNNIDCEFAKLAHNCFGAMKVTYFNMIYDLAKSMGGNYEKIREGFSITGFIEQQHTNIAPDGNFGYGGKCFPTNIKAMFSWLSSDKRRNPENNFFRIIDQLNSKYRQKNEI